MKRKLTSQQKYWESTKCPKCGKHSKARCLGEMCNWGCNCEMSK